MQKYFLTCLILCLFLTSVFVHAEESEYEKTEREAAEYKMNRIKEKAAQLDVDIQFYGKVIDQYGKPVDSADVMLGITRFSPLAQLLFGEIKNVKKITDAQGNFVVTGEKGRSIDLDRIQKVGYEFSLSQNPVRGFDYSGIQNPFIPDPSMPAVFHMRKMGETTFLIQENYLKLNLHISEFNMTTGVDLVRQIKIDNLANPIFNGEKLTCDLKMTATFNTANKIWSVVLSPGDSNGGIIAFDRTIYEAPETGYQSEYAFIAEDNKLPEKKSIYLRSRDPAIYTRFEIEYATVCDDFVSLRGTSVTNPYGDRNLEQAPDLPYAVIKKLTDEIRSAYKQNKRPVKPDLQKLINEAK